MKLSVRHTTRYRFDHPVRGVVQSLRLWPADCASQKVLSWEVRTEGATRGAEFTDGAGDRTALASWRARFFPRFREQRTSFFRDFANSWIRPRKGTIDKA